MTLSANSRAAAVGAGVKNVSFVPSSDNVPRKILIIGTPLAAKTDVVPEVPVICLSPEDAGDKYGFGSMLHRLAVQTFLGGQGVETWIIPQDEASASVAATGSIAFAGTTGVIAGTIYLYIAGLPVLINIATGTTAAQVATAVVAAIEADDNLPVSAAVNGTTNTLVDITSKSEGPWGNEITIKFNIKAGQTLPVGVLATVTDMASGAGIPDISDALDALGTDDDANEAFFTELVHGYGYDTTTLDRISTYVGAGNDFIGLYDKLVARPFRSLTGDTTAGSGGLSAILIIGAARKTDRANGVLCVPGSANHPSEIAAQAIGYMARTNNDRAAQGYIGAMLIDIDPGDKSDRWTNQYDSRDTAVKGGVSPTRIQNGVVTLQNVMSFYHPDSVPISSNGYAQMRNISVIQNIMYNIRSNFEKEKWQGFSIVEDIKKVSSTVDRQKARDIDSVIDDLVALAVNFAGKAWLYSASYTIDSLKKAGAVSIRSGGIGFDSIFPVLLSGEGGILDTVTEFDTSIAVML